MDPSKFYFDAETDVVINDRRKARKIAADNDKRIEEAIREENLRLRGDPEDNGE